MNLAFIEIYQRPVQNASALVVSGGNAITVTGFSSNSVQGDTAGAGMSISNVIFDATPGGAVQAVDADTLAVGTAANPVGQGGLAVVTSTGSISLRRPRRLLCLRDRPQRVRSRAGLRHSTSASPQSRLPAPARARSSPRTARPWR